MKRKAKKHLKGCIQEARQFYGLGGPEWNFQFAVKDRPGDSKSAVAMVWPNDAYLNVYIEFKRGLKKPKAIREYAWHEVAHAALAGMSKAARDMAEQIEDERMRDVLLERFEAEEEKFIQRTTRSVLACLRVEKDEAEAEPQALDAQQPGDEADS